MQVAHAAQEVTVMTEPVRSAAVEPPDISHLVFEDGAPVDSVFCERQMQILLDALYASWDGGGRPFVAFANVGLFYALYGDPIVPDVMVSQDVVPPPNTSEPQHKSYLVWEFGKPPDIAVEIVSNKVGDEIGKLEKYAHAGVPYVIVYDPDRYLRGTVLRLFEVHGRGYVEMLPNQSFGDLGLGVTVWDGEYRGLRGPFLRWCDTTGQLLPTSEERTKAEVQRAEAEAQRAEAEAQRAEAEARRADAAEARTRELLARLEALERDAEA